MWCFAHLWTNRLPTGSCTSNRSWMHFCSDKPKLLRISFDWWFQTCLYPWECNDDPHLLRLKCLAELLKLPVCAGQTFEFRRLTPLVDCWFPSCNRVLCQVKSQQDNCRIPIITMKSIFIGVYTHHYLQIRHGVDDRKLYTSRSTWYTTPPWFKSPTPWWTWNKHHIFPKHIPIGPIGGCSCGYTKWHHHMVFSTPPKLGYKPYNCGYTLW